MFDVFISYPRVERLKAEIIRRELDALGLRCFVDVEDIDGGAEFPAVIDEAVKSARVVLACWSPDAFRRSWVIRECRVGLMRGVLVPVAVDRFDEIEVPTEFIGVNYLDLVGWTGDRHHEGWRRTLRAIGNLVGRDLVSVTANGSPQPLATVSPVIGTDAVQDGEQRADRIDAHDEAAFSSWLEEDRTKNKSRRKAGQQWRDKFVSLPELAAPLMVTIPPGKFQMGSPETELGRLPSEGPQHEVRIQHTFAIGKFVITFLEWDAAIAAGAPLKEIGTGKRDWSSSDQGWGRGGRPVIGVTWGDAQDYITWLNERLSGSWIGPYRLPTEAEWEYACRAGTTSPYSFGARILSTQANFKSSADSTGGNTTPVGSYPANRFGLHDMHGNVAELCEDGWYDNYLGAPDDGSARETGDMPVVRGGSWFDTADDIRSASRTWPSPPMLVAEVGFRVARTL